MRSNMESGSGTFVMIPPRFRESDRADCYARATRSPLIDNDRTEKMSKQANIASQQKFGEAVNSGNLEIFRDVVAPDALDHDPAPGQGRGPDGYIQFFTQFRSAFPDLQITVDHLTADDDSVAIAYTVTGTHKGDFLGVPATGRSMSARGVQIARFDPNARMVERWGSSDQLGILQQIGAAPTNG